MPTLTAFDYAILRVVPQVEREEFINVGAILFCRQQRFLEARVALDDDRLTALFPHSDVRAVRRYLDQIVAISRGDPSAGQIATLSISERFHWLTAPRSTIIQTSRVHSGLCLDAASELDRIMQATVGPAPPAQYSG